MKEEVTPRVLLLGRDRMTVVFGPKAPPPNVAEVRFRGTRVIDARHLVKELSAVAVGTPYLEENFRLFLDWQVKAMYEGVGHLQAAFPRVSTEPAANGRGVVVTVEVAEGPLYKLSGVEVRGTPLAPDEIQELGQFKTDQAVSYSQLAVGMGRIVERLKKDGHMRAGYKADRALDQEKRTAAIQTRTRKPLHDSPRGPAERRQIHGLQPSHGPQSARGQLDRQDRRAEDGLLLLP